MQAAFLLLIIYLFAARNSQFDSNEWINHPLMRDTYKLNNLNN